MGDDKRGRRQASPLHPEQLGDEARRGDPGATLAVAHPESSTASFPSYEVASRPGPNEAIGKTGMGDHKGRPYADVGCSRTLDAEVFQVVVADDPFVGLGVPAEVLLES